MAEEICGNCKYSRSIVESEERIWKKKSIKFFCHFSPPSMEGWPPVNDSDWCGRFEATE